MTDKEKAKAYDEAIEKAKKYHTPDSNNTNLKAVLEHIFPVLTESEDERIRKWLIEMVEELRKANPTNAEHNGDCNEAIAYLEKQEHIATEAYNKGFADGTVAERESEELEKQKEQKPVKLNNDTEVGLDRALQIIKDAKGNLCGYQSDDGIYECNHAIQTLERILKNGIEQKPANTIESKFKSGDRIRFNGFGSNEYTIQLVGNGYYVNSEGGRMDMSYTDANFVLVENAQKEQQPAEWSDDIIRKAVKEVGLTQHQIDWFKTNVFPPKPEWSEEDEQVISAMIRDFESEIAVWEHKEIESGKSAQKHINIYKGFISFIKSLRPRHITYTLDAPLCYDNDMNPIYPPINHWKPSEKQMEVLYKYAEQNNYDGSVLTSLYNDLKKL